MLTGIIDAHIAEVRGKEQQKSDKFRVSSAGTCRLARSLKRQGVQETDPPDARQMRVFEVGHIVHNWIQDILAKREILIAREATLEDDHRRGHLDAIVTNGEGLILYDIKTVHSKKFSFLETGEIDAHYAHQIVTYAEMWNKAHPDQLIKDCRIVYVSKDDLRIAEKPVWIDEWQGAVDDDWGILIDAWREGYSPAPSGPKWMCGYCGFRSGCKRRLDGK